MMQANISVSDKKVIPLEIQPTDKALTKDLRTPPVPPKTRIVPKPGSIKVDALLTLHTKIAYHYFYGRRGKTSSLTVFSKKMTFVWQAAALDDPYADRVLLQVYDAIVQAKRRLQALRTKYQKVLNESNLEFGDGATTTPIKVPLKFGSPYGFMAASMIKEFDNLARCIILAQQLGIALDKKYIDILRIAGDTLRDVFNKPQKWKKTDITRQDVKNSTSLAEHAVKLMGKLDEKIVAGSLRAPNAPRIIKPKPASV